MCKSRNLILKLYNQGVSKPEIIKQTGYSKTYVYRVLANEGFGYKSLAKELIKQVLELASSGLSVSQIYDRLRLKVSRPTIYRILSKNQIKPKTTNCFKHLAEEIVRLYNSGLSGGEIAVELKISKSTAAKYIRLNCNVRSLKQKPRRSIKSRNKLFLSELDYFNRVAYCEWRKSDKRIPIEDFKQSAYASALRAAELWDSERATYRTYAVRCITFGFLSLYRDNPSHYSLPEYSDILK